MRIILASNSPRRKALMEDVYIVFDVVPPTIEEKLDNKQTPTENVRRLAQEKCHEVFLKNSDCLVIGADTIVVLDGEILGKPKDEADAFAMLKKLQGRKHQVITGLAMESPKLGMTVESEVSEVEFLPLTDEEIKDYIQTGEPLGKAGGYAIQGEGAKLIKEYTGDYTNIVGLPMYVFEEMFGKHI